MSVVFLIIMNLPFPYTGFKNKKIELPINSVLAAFGKLRKKELSNRQLSVIAKKRKPG